MRVILNHDILFNLLDTGYHFSQEHRTTDSGHILDTDFIATSLNQLLGHIEVIFYGMYRRISDTKTAL